MANNGLLTPALTAPHNIEQHTLTAGLVNAVSAPPGLTTGASTPLDSGGDTWHDGIGGTQCATELIGR